MRFLLIFAAILAMTGGAQAALVTYDLTFFADPDGQGAVQVGTGQLSYDPAVTEEIWFDDTGQNLCQPNGDPFCFYQATWTPMTISYVLFGAPGSIGAYLEGSVIFVKTVGLQLLPGEWYGRDYYDLGLTIGGTLPGLLWWNANELPTLPPAFDAWLAAGGAGTATAELSAVPLPAAAWLFLAGLSILGFRTKKSVA